MEKIFVDLGKESYTIAIEPHSWSGFGKKIRALSRGDKAAVITDRTVDGLYGADLEQQLRAEGFQVRRLVMEPGEDHKNLDTYGNMVRANDCPGDPCANRVRTTNLRTVSLAPGI